MGEIDAYANVKVQPALNPVDFVTTCEGLLVDIRGYNGVAQGFVHIYEDASQAATELLDVTVHNVASDSEAPVTGNKVATFTQVVGANGSAVQVLRRVAIPLNDCTKQYLQLLFTETNTYECYISACIALTGAKQGPVNT